MKTGLIIMAFLLPLFVVLVLAVAGITLDLWVYIVLGIACPLAAAIVWSIYRDMEKKVSQAGKGR